jgi:hypothetical protein
MSGRSAACSTRWRPARARSRAGRRRADQRDPARHPRPMMEMAPLSPPAFERAVKQCLAKDPDDRWQSAGDLKARAGMDRGRARADGSGRGGAASRSQRRASPAFIAATLALASIVVAACTPWPGTPDRCSPCPCRPGSRSRPRLSRPLPIAISRDGTRIAFAGHEVEGVDRLWVRTLSSSDARPLPGTERAEGRSSRRRPFDRLLRRWQLRRVDFAGGPVTLLADMSGSTRGHLGARRHDLYAPTAPGRSTAFPPMAAPRSPSPPSTHPWARPPIGIRTCCRTESTSSISRARPEPEAGATRPSTPPIWVEGSESPCSRWHRTSLRLGPPAVRPSGCAGRAALRPAPERGPRSGPDRDRRLSPWTSASAVHRSRCRTMA